MAPMINAAPVVFLNAGSIPLNGIICAMAVVRKMGGELAVDPGGGRGGGGHRGVSRSLLRGTCITMGLPRHVCTRLGRKGE